MPRWGGNTVLNIKNYVRVQSLEEAYDLCQKKNNVVLGGMLWLKMQRRSVGTAIDLSDLGLDKIEEDGDFYRLGAMEESLRHIVGVQFRNLATVGGSLWGRFGFSDVLTLLLSLDAQVELYHDGRMSLEEFTQLPRQQHDILTHVLIPKEGRQVVYQSQRNISTDFPTLTCALSKKDGAYTCVIGARPQMAQVYRDEKGLLTGGVTEETARAFGEDVAQRAKFGSSLRAGEDYRREICAVLVRRGLLAMEKEG